MEVFNKRVRLTNQFAKKFKFLVICEKSIDQNFPKPRQLKYEAGSIVEFQYFLTNEAGKLELATFEWFQEGKCNDPELKQLNSFSKSTLKWESQLEVKDKFMDFNQCPITLQISGQSKKNFCNINGIIYNFDIQFYNAMASKGNFKANSIIFPEKVRRQPTLKPEDIQLLLTQGDYVSNIKINAHSTATFAQTSYGFIMPPGQLYTSYEKLIMPFDELTWMFLILTFGFSFGFIFIVKKYAPWFIQNWIFGSAVTTPAYNLLSIFFGVSQVRVPVENSARFILITFLYFCLVIRTAYQGVFFEMFTHDLRRPLPQTIEEMHDQDFTIYYTVPELIIFLNQIEESRR
jgi:hypothetical protein